MYKVTSLETTNLKLIPYSTNDIEYVVKLHTLAETSVYDDIDKPKDSLMLKERINNYLNNDTLGWICWSKQTSQRIGIVYFTNIVFGLSAMFHPVLDGFGFKNYLKRTKNKIHIIDEASKIALLEVFEILKLKRVTGGYFCNNFSMIELCKRLGFREEGIIRNGTLRNNISVDIKLFGLLPGELKL